MVRNVAHVMVRACVGHVAVVVNVVVALLVVSVEQHHVVLVVVQEHARHVAPRALVLDLRKDVLLVVLVAPAQHVVAAGLSNLT